MEWVLGLLVLLMVLSLVALIGHGLWELLAWIFRGGKPRQAPRDAQDELKTAAIQVSRLAMQERISRSASSEVLDAIAAERRRLTFGESIRPTARVVPPPLPVQTFAVEPAAVEIAVTSPVFDANLDVDTATVEAAASFAVPPPVFPPPPPPPAPPRAPRRPWSEVLISFMEQRNIRWGELVGGLLIVGCSVALVLSFWAQIAQRPVLKFSIFTAVTGALFGLGLYTEHRWKLPTTSRGVLVIATLLVPLNFLAFAAFSLAGPTFDPVALGGEAIAFALFLWLLRAAAKVIAPQWPWVMAIGVLALSAASLAVRYVAPRSGMMPAGLLLGLGTAAVSVYVGSSAVMLARARRWPDLDEPGANAVLLMVGVLSFAVIFPLALLVSRSADALETARRLAPLVAVCGVPAASAGLLLWRRIKDRSLAGLRTAGTAVAVGGALIMTAAIALAWPNPGGMLPVAAIDCLVIATLACVYRIPAGHLLAAACGIVAGLLGFHLFCGHVTWVSTSPALLAALQCPDGGTALAAIVAAWLAASEAFRRVNRIDDSRWAVLAAALTAAASLLIATWDGFARQGDPYFVAYLYGGYAAAAFAVAWRWRAAAGGWIGWALLLATTLQALAAHASAADPWALGLLAFSTLAVAGAVAGVQLERPWRRIFAVPASWFATFASIAAAGFVLWRVSLVPSDPHFGTLNQAAALRLGWLSILWLFLALTRTSPAWLNAGLLSLAASVTMAVFSQLVRRDWFAHDPAPFADPWTWQTVAVALSTFAVACEAVRLLVARLASPNFKASEGEATSTARPVSNWLESARALAMRRWSADRLVLLVLGIVLLALGVYAVHGGVAAELTAAGTLRASTLTPIVAAAHAAGYGSWLLLAALILALGALWRQGFRDVARQGLLITAWAACPLLAAHAHAAAASALRWTIGLYLLAGTAAFSLPALLRRPGDLMRGRITWPGDVRQILLILGVLPLVTLSVYPVLAAMTGMTVHGPAIGSFFARVGPAISYATPLVVLAGLLAVDALARRSNGAALASMLAFDLAATCGYLMAYLAPAEPFGLHWLIRLVQLNAAVTSAFALAWFGVLILAARRRQIDLVLPKALRLSTTVALLAVAIEMLPAVFELFVTPDGATDYAPIVGSVLGWAALVLAGVASLLVNAPRRDRISLPVARTVLLALPAMTAFAMLGAARGTWLAFHTWMYGQTAAAWAMLGLGWWLHRGGIGEAIPSSRVPPPPPLAPPPLTLAENTPAIVLAIEQPATGQPSSEQPAIDELANAAAVTIAPPPLLEYQHAVGTVVQPTVYIGGHDIRASAARWACGLGVLAVVLALRAVIGGDPALPWPSVGVIGLVSLIGAVAAIWLIAPAYLYGAAALMNLAASVWYLGERGFRGASSLVELIEVNVIALAAPAVAWLVLEWQVFQPRAGNLRHRARPVHRVAAIIAVIAGALAAGLPFGLHLAGAPLRSDLLLACSAIVATGALLAACLWDSQSRHALAGLYLLGLTAGAMLLDRFNLPPDRLAWAGALLLAGYGWLTGGLWSVRESLPSRLRLAEAETWLAPANLLLAGVVGALAFWSDFTFTSPAMRFATAFAAMSQAGAIALLCRGRPAPSMRQAAGVIAIAGTVSVAWAGVAPHADPWWLVRSVTLLAILLPIAIAGALGAERLARLAGHWADAARRLTPAAITAALLAIAVVLGCEFAAQSLIDHVPMHPVGIAGVIVLLIGACAAAIALALSARRDPFGLSDRGRQAYVYAAELVLAAALVHVRLTMPFLFHGFVRQYWPVVVMLIAFAGVGAGDAFRRRNKAVLAEPLHYTGVFLPLLPVIAFWAAESRVHYSMLLTLVALLYGTLALLHRSFRYGLLAALAANAGLWYLLYHTESLGFLVHPQFWVVPAALSVLAAAELNRTVLSREQTRLIRYATLVAVYVSSTADIFINGAAHSPWLPLILALLSVAGVLGGVSLRIRPFLFLGTGFLMLAIVAMIWNAAANFHWTWLWYVAGIVLGGCIIALFALFEKKRPEMLAMIEGLRAWE